MSGEDRLPRHLVATLEQARIGYMGIEFQVSSPEDTILAKLRWSRLGGDTPKTHVDVLRVYEVQKDLLDHAYLEEWAARLEIGDLWERLKREAEPG